MNWRVTIREDAKADIREARDWYDDQRAGLGDEFLYALIDAFIKLEEAPAQYPVYYRDFRRLITDRFPYKVFFRIDGEVVIVFRVLHAARDHTRHIR